MNREAKIQAVEEKIWDGIDEATKMCMDCCTTKDHCKKIATAVVDSLGVNENKIDEQMAQGILKQRKVKSEYMQASIIIARNAIKAKALTTDIITIGEK